MYPIYPLVRDTFSSVRFEGNLLWVLAGTAYRRPPHLDKTASLLSEQVLRFFREYKDTALTQEDLHVLELCQEIRTNVPFRYWDKLFPNKLEDFLALKWGDSLGEKSGSSAKLLYNEPEVSA